MTWPGMRCSGGKNILDALSYRSGIWQSTVKEQNDVGEILYPGVDPVVKGSGQRVNFFGKMLSPRGGANFGDWNICERKQIASFNFLNGPNKRVANANINFDRFKHSTVQPRLYRETKSFSALRRQFSLALGDDKNKLVFVLPLQISP